MSERRKSRRFDSEKPASSRTGGIPVFGLVDLKKNRDFRLIKQDLEERGRMREKGPAKGGPKEEVLYVDATRNVGVVLGKEGRESPPLERGTKNSKAFVGWENT